MSHYLISPFSQTSTYFFRNNLTLPEWFENLQSNDATIFCVATKDKKIKYFKEVFSVYRIRNNNYSYSKTARLSFNKTKYFLEKIDDFTNYKYKNIIRVRKWINSIYIYKLINNNVVVRFLVNVQIMTLFIFSYLFYREKN